MRKKYVVEHKKVDKKFGRKGKKGVPLQRFSREGHRKGLGKRGARSLKDWKEASVVQAK